ncbi:MAG: hypothetical protein MJ174_10590 [Treponema sp.]|nr:hypothetical protein [Treponema sp.]
MKFFTGVLSGVVLTTIGIVTAALISIKKEEKATTRAKADESILITGFDYEDCVKKLCDSLHDKSHISSLEISILGNGYEVLADFMEKMKSEISAFFNGGIDITWNVNPQHFMEAAISVVVRY